MSSSQWMIRWKRLMNKIFINWVDWIGFELPTRTYHKFRFCFAPVRKLLLLNFWCPESEQYQKSVRRSWHVPFGTLGKKVWWIIINHHISNRQFFELDLRCFSTFDWIDQPNESSLRRIQLRNFSIFFISLTLNEIGFCVVIFSVWKDLPNYLFENIELCLIVNENWTKMNLIDVTGAWKKKNLETFMLMRFMFHLPDRLFFVSNK